jgi:hypothetical protein
MAADRNPFVMTKRLETYGALHVDIRQLVFFPLLVLLLFGIFKFRLTFHEFLNQFIDEFIAADGSSLSDNGRVYEPRIRGKSRNGSPFRFRPPWSNQVLR